MSEAEKKKSETPLLDGVEELSVELIDCVLRPLVRLAFKATKLMVREVKEVLKQA